MSMSLKQTTKLLSIDIVKAILTNNMFVVPLTLVELTSVIAFYDVMNQNVFKNNHSKRAPLLWAK